MKQLPSTSKPTRTVISTLFFCVGLSFVTCASASQAEHETSEPQMSTSFGDSVNKVDQAGQDDTADKQKNLIKVKSTSSNKSGKNRQQVIIEKKSTTPSRASALNHQDDHFSIYDAQTSLFTDEDQDGFYRSFSLVFDADYHRFDEFDQAQVYAELYLSKNGGPWLHYFTTDAYIIHSESTEDAYEVTTTLVDGYRPDHYDVLIDLYEVGFTDIVASYSGDDSNALYALPIESELYDIYHPPVKSSGHGGSFSALTLLLILLMGGLRRLSCSRCEPNSILWLAGCWFR